MARCSRLKHPKWYTTGREQAPILSPPFDRGLKSFLRSFCDFSMVVDGAHPQMARRPNQGPPLKRGRAQAGGSFDLGGRYCLLAQKSSYIEAGLIFESCFLPYTHK